MLQVLSEYQIFKSLVLGDQKTIGFYAGAFFFCFLTLLVALWLHSRKRDKSSPNTPANFSWYFLIWDNTKRIGVNLIVMFLFFRFTPAMSMEWAAGIGILLSYGVDKALQRFMERSGPISDLLRMNRDNFPTKPQP